ncbi:ABC transporter permease [Amycolatopsis circi]|uniref:ABC transporter permease n=1 Tax=Amycolatopsis circi TaxID=871959 RepID=UPI000E2378C6|nr:ABC transporter permease [Amycolatopsis circi]
MLRLALSTLRFRKAGFTATFVALLVGTAIVMACGGLMQTGISPRVPPQRLAEAPVVVAGDQHYDLPPTNPGTEDEDHESATLPERVRLDASLGAKIAAVPGVAKVIPDVSIPATLPGDPDAKLVRGAALGHDWATAELAPYSLTDGRAPQRSGEVVLDQATAAATGAAAGGSVQIAVRGGVRSFQVVGIAVASGKIASDAVFFSHEDALALTPATGQVDAFGVLPTAGTDPAALSTQIANVVRDQHAVALTGVARGTAEFAQASDGGEILVILAAVFGGLAVQVALFVVASTLGLSVQQRRREVALLRAVGATPKQVSRMITAESMVIGVLATVLAAFPGELLGNWLFDRLSGFGVFEPVLAYHQDWIPTAAGILVGLLSAWGAGFVAARYAGRTRPVEAMQELVSPKRWLTSFRLWWGIGSLIGGVALAYLTITVMDGPLAASTAGPAVTLVAAAVALFAPGITRLMVAVLRVPVRAVSGLSGYLAMANARVRWLPMSGAVVPVMLATTLAVFMLYFQTTQVESAKQKYASNLSADAVVTSSTGDVSTGLLDKVRTLPGVGTASAYVTSKGYNEKPSDPGQDEDGLALTGVTGDAVAKTRAAELASGSLNDLRGNTIALPADNADRLHAKVGDEIGLRLGDGTQVRLRVVATLRSAPAFATALMPAGTLAPHTTDGIASQVLVTAAAGTSVSQLMGTLDGLAQDSPGVQVANRDTLTAKFVQEQEANAWVNYLVVGMILLYAAISVVNTLVLSTAHRRREFGLQRLAGSSRGQVLGVMAVEGMVVAIIGVVLGTAVSLAMLVPFSQAVSDSWLPYGPLWIYAVVVLLAVVVSMVATLFPTWLAVRGKTSIAMLSPE